MFMTLYLHLLFQAVSNFNLLLKDLNIIAFMVTKGQPLVAYNDSENIGRSG